MQNFYWNQSIEFWTKWRSIQSKTFSLLCYNVLEQAPCLVCSLRSLIFKFRPSTSSNGLNNVWDTTLRWYWLPTVYSRIHCDFTSTFCNCGHSWASRTRNSLCKMLLKNKNKRNRLIAMLKSCALTRKKSSIASHADRTALQWPKKKWLTSSALFRKRHLRSVAKKPSAQAMSDNLY